MEDIKENTDFVNFGTYKAEEADILKHELEKQGVPVKIIYPGTSIGRETTAKVYFPSYTLMIRACDFPIAEKVRKNFNIKPIEAEEKMPLPKSYAWAKRGLNRFALIGYIVSLIGILISGYLADRLRFLSQDTPFYFIFAFFFFFFLWICTTIHNIFKEKKNY